jgi:glycosyltransferase involved in cell wall biosynthesis
MKYIDVGLIPYVKNEFTGDVSPIKLYEYMAMGKPVVSTDFSEELHAYEDLIGIAQDKASFVTLVDDILKNDNHENATKRLSAARQHSWSKRIEFVTDKMALLCSKTKT